VIVNYTFGDRRRKPLRMTTDILPRQDEVIGFEGDKGGWEWYRVLSIKRFIEKESNHEYLEIHLI